MEAQKLPDGRLLVPRRASDGGGTLGDAAEVIGPDHADYPAWERWLARQGGAPEGDRATQLLALLSLRGRLEGEEYAAAARELLGGEGDETMTESDVSDVLEGLGR